MVALSTDFHIFPQGGNEEHYFLPIQPDFFRSSMYIQTKLAPAFVIKIF